MSSLNSKIVRPGPSLHSSVPVADYQQPYPPALFLLHVFRFRSLLERTRLALFRSAGPSPIKYAVPNPNRWRQVPARLQVWFFSEFQQCRLLLILRILFRSLACFQPLRNDALSYSARPEIYVLSFPPFHRTKDIVEFQVEASGSPGLLSPFLSLVRNSIS